MLILALILYITSTLHVTSAVTEIKVGVPLVSHSGAPYDIERVGPAIEIAIQRVNSEFLNDSYKIVKLERHYGNLCSNARAPGVVADLFYKENIVAMFGPACAYALDVSARLAHYWNIPVVTGLGDGGIFKFKDEYPTLTRLAYCQCRLRKVFGSVFIQFGWSDISMIYDVNDVHSNVLASTLKVGLQKQNFYPNLFDYYDNNPDRKGILQQAASKSRVILLIVSGDSLREFMLEAYDLGFVQSGEFVFMDVELFPFPGDYYGNHDWRRGDARDQDAKEAYTSLLRVALNEPTTDEWLNFTSRVKEMASDMYNFTYGSEKVNFFVGAFHDAVLVYGMALNESLEAGETDLYLDGYNFTRRMWDRNFHGVTGDVIIDDNGDRDTSYSILDMDQATGDFRVVANFWGDRQYYNPVEGVEIHWAGERTSPPPNEPRCGFEGDSAVCQPAEEVPAYVSALIACLAGVLILVLVALVTYRRYRREKDLLSMSWLVPFKDLKEFKGLGWMSKASLRSLSKRSTDETKSSVDSVMNEQLFTRVSLYKGNKVAVKKLTDEKIILSREILLEMKQMQDMVHGNVTRFVGACVEPGLVAVLSEYCSKGSLQDVLLNDSINLDWTFRMALLKDIISGLQYLHKSELRCHGKLSSSNCVVDGRFVVKLTDFGLRSLYAKQTKATMTHAHREKLLWRAPELLRACTPDFSPEGDVYSLGIIIAELINRSGPFDNCSSDLSPDEILARILSRQTPPFRPEICANECPSGVVPLAVACWQDDPTKRPVINEIKQRVTAITGGKNVTLMETLLERMEQYAGNLEQIVEERTQQLEVEKRKSEALLYQILPKSVAEQLRSGQHVVPEAFDSVTIYFSDIVGFTALSSESTPLQVVDLLNDLYTVCDSVIDNYDVYKVETIGDAYMVVSGLPVRNGIDHAANICRMALSFLQHLQTFEVRHRPGYKLQLRSGIHSGPCVAGVVGLKMPRYCLFGDTVNTASRMESNGEAQKIHISSVTRDILDNFPTFKTKYRGEIEAKGKGAISTYWLLEE